MALILFIHMDTLFIRWFFLWRIVLGASRSPKDQMWHQWQICMSNVCAAGSWISSWQSMENAKTSPVMLHSVKLTGQTHPLQSSQEKGHQGKGAVDPAKVSLTLQEGLSCHYFCRSDHSDHVLSAFTTKFPSSYTANGHIFGAHLSDKRISIRCY